MPVSESLSSNTSSGFVSLKELTRWCDTTLQVSKFKDYAPNGLQVEGSPTISKIVTGVTASLSLIEAAIAENADAILVHHGYFWKGEDPCLTGMKGRRIRRLLHKNISLIAYHLPLDAHPQLGNNIAFAELMGFTTLGGLNPDEKYPIGNLGECEPTTVPAMAELLRKTLGRRPFAKWVGVQAARRILFIKLPKWAVMLIFLAKSVSVLFMTRRNWAFIILNVVIMPPNAVELCD
jgi:putative NIF3 family GTP cyclohydrolase 1 type 2